MACFVAISRSSRKIYDRRPDQRSGGIDNVGHWLTTGRTDSTGSGACLCAQAVSSSAGNRQAARVQARRSLLILSCSAVMRARRSASMRSASAWASRYAFLVASCFAISASVAALAFERSMRRIAFSSLNPTISQNPSMRMVCVMKPISSAGRPANMRVRQGRECRRSCRYPFASTQPAMPATTADLQDRRLQRRRDLIAIPPPFRRVRHITLGAGREWKVTSRPQPQGTGSQDQQSRLYRTSSETPR